VSLQWAYSRLPLVRIVFNAAGVTAGDFPWGFFGGPAALLAVNVRLETDRAGPPFVSGLILAFAFLLVSLVKQNVEHIPSPGGRATFFRCGSSSLVIPLVDDLHSTSLVYFCGPLRGMIPMVPS
jgi:hypothetical protein